MGEDPATVHWTGCPSIDAIAAIDLSLPTTYSSDTAASEPISIPASPMLSFSSIR